jgi:hypothetical protein
MGMGAGIEMGIEMGWMEMGLRRERCGIDAGTEQAITMS